MVLRLVEIFHSSGQRQLRARWLCLENEVSTEQLEQALQILEQERVLARKDGIAAPTVEHRIGSLLKKEGLLQKYRAVQTLHFTDLKAQILEKIPEKLDNASLKDLTSAFKVFHDAERDIEDPGRHVKGIVAYLVHIEQAETAGKDPLNYGEVIDVQAEPVLSGNRTEDGIKIPKL